MDSNQFRQAAHAAIEDIISRHESQGCGGDIVPRGLHPGEIAQSFPSEAPQQGTPWPEIHNDFQRLVHSNMTDWNKPGFAAFFPACTSYPSILGELYSASYGGSMFNWICSPAATELEVVVMDWIVRAMALPAQMRHGEGLGGGGGGGGGGGLMMSSGSEAILTVMTAARDRARDRLGRGTDASRQEASDLVVLGAASTHGSTEKAARILGVQYVEVETDESTIITAAGLRKTLTECARNDQLPFFITATLGSTTTCAIDDLAGIAQVMAEQEDPKFLWGHVDASYGGNALICPEYRHLADSLAGFDSLNVNLNKWLMVNVDASCLFVQSQLDVAKVLSSTPSYLQKATTGGEGQPQIEPHDLTLTLSRRFRALKVWFVFRSYGLASLQSHIRTGIKLGDRFASLIAQEAQHFRLVTEPRLGLVVFHVLARHGDDDNAITLDLLDRLNRSGRCYVTGCRLGRRDVVRFVTSHQGASAHSVDEAFALILRLTRELKGVEGDWEEGLKAKEEYLESKTHELLVSKG